MPSSFRYLITGLAFLLLGSATLVAGPPPSRTVPLTPEAWTATDSIRFVTHLGRPALYINRGVALAREAAMDFLRGIGTSWGAQFDAPADVHRVFREETGLTFARWRYAARMRIARDLLAGGAKPSAVTRRVGYAHLATFSAAFSRFHGLSPRDYQEREAEQLPSTLF